MDQLTKLELPRTMLYSHPMNYLGKGSNIKIFIRILVCLTQYVSFSKKVVFCTPKHLKNNSDTVLMSINNYQHDGPYMRQNYLVN